MSMRMRIGQSLTIDSKSLTINRSILENSRKRFKDYSFTLKLFCCHYVNISDLVISVRILRLFHNGYQSVCPKEVHTHLLNIRSNSAVLYILNSQSNCSFTLILFCIYCVNISDSSVIAVRNSNAHPDLVISVRVLRLFHNNRVFPKWISLNSVNHDKIQKWYGYQTYYPSGNRYITSANKKKFLITTSG